jgi:putative copper resistance protein D
MAALATLVRFFHLGAGALLLGVLSFILLIALPAGRKAGPESPAALGNFERFQLRLAWWALLVVFFTVLLGLWLQVVTVTSLPLVAALTAEAMGGLLTGTRYGIVAIVRLLLLILLAGILLAQSRKASMLLRLAGVLLAAALMMALAFSGHAAAGEGTALLLQLTVDSLHLLAAGFWVGGLIPLALLLHRAWRSDEPAARIAAREAVRRFSLLGLLSVSILIVTGFLNTRNLVGGVAQLVGTAYGRLLIIKLSLLLPLIVIAAINLLGLKPKILAAALSDASGTFKALLGALKRNVLAEALLGTVILLLVGGMSITPPGRHIQPEWPFSFRWYWNVTKGSQKIRSQVITGSAIAVLGLLALSTALLRRRERHWTFSIGLTGIGYGGIIALPALFIDAYPTTYRRPAVAYHAISVANGSRLYLESCAPCTAYWDSATVPRAKDSSPNPPI